MKMHSLRPILDEAFEVFGDKSEHVVSWLGNSPRIAQQSYLLVTEDDFAREAGAKKVLVEG
jgi:hypothetical protein